MKFIFTVIIASFPMMFNSCSYYFEHELNIEYRNSTIDDLNLIKQALSAYRRDESQEANDLKRLVPRYLVPPPDNKTGLFVDSWGNEIQYRADVKKLISAGPDGHYETGDDIIISTDP